LQARLGADQVQRLVPVQDHRPERASLAVPVTGVLPGGQVACAGVAVATASRPAATAMATHTTRPTPVRPIWLLAPPQALNERDHQPLLDGRELHLLSGPERIEAGWWDAALAERDYFIAQTGDGALVWVYRARVPLPTGECGWFLQGRFG
jgi:protein ImuB